MKQYVFYDAESGEVRHIHQVLSAEKNQLVEVDDKQLAEQVERMVDVGRTPWIHVEVPPTSSRAAVRHVDTEKRRLRTTRLPAREQERARRTEG